MEFPDIGKHCAFKECHQLDFLPFTCSYCKQSFCSDHWKVNEHTCPKYDPSQNDVRVPECPICHQAVPTPRGQDPNLRMDRHITTECGKAKARNANICNAKKCHTHMVVPIQCTTCRKQFCPKHRFPADHQCSSNSYDRSKGNGNVAERNTPAALAAMKRLIASSQSQTPSSESKSNDSLKKAAAKPFVQVSANRRAKAERASRIKALKDRDAKGILSERDKITLAELMAEESRSMPLKKDGDCHIA